MSEEKKSEEEPKKITDEEKEIVNNVKGLTEKDIFELEKVELFELNKVIRKDEGDKDITDD